MMGPPKPRPYPYNVSPGSFAPGTMWLDQHSAPSYEAGRWVRLSARTGSLTAKRILTSVLALLAWAVGILALSLLAPGCSTAGPRFPAYALVQCERGPWMYQRETGLPDDLTCEVVIGIIDDVVAQSRPWTILTVPEAGAWLEARRRSSAVSSR